MTISCIILEYRPNPNVAAWVEGNVPNYTDASGRCVDNMVLGNLSGRFLLGDSRRNLANSNKTIGQSLMRPRAQQATGAGNDCGADQANPAALVLGQNQDLNLNIYVDFVSAMSDFYMSEAQRRLTEIQSICNNNFSTGVANNACREFSNMSVPEFAARMAAIPMALNVAGWLQDRNFFTTNLAGLAGMFVGYELQSAGFLELRGQEFSDLALGITHTAINLDPIREINNVTRGARPNGCLIRSRHGSISVDMRCYRAYLMGGSADIISSGGLDVRLGDELLVELTATRYANNLVQFFDFLADDANAQANPFIFERGGSNRWAIRCTSGVASGPNICAQRNASIPNDGG